MLCTYIQALNVLIMKPKSSQLGDIRFLTCYSRTFYLCAEYSSRSCYGVPVHAFYGELGCAGLWVLCSECHGLSRVRCLVGNKTDNVGWVGLMKRPLLGPLGHRSLASFRLLSLSGRLRPWPNLARNKGQLRGAGGNARFRPWSGEIDQSAALWKRSVSFTRSKVLMWKNTEKGKRVLKPGAI
ncbi:hypothetical protein L209DRAFT_265842 [Thermothelomyces heterothallicus CBS 203.75]